MGRKIFVSYKHEDTAVAPLGLSSIIFDYPTTARDYVNHIGKLLEQGDHIDKGEKEDEDLSGFKDETIASHLRDRIYDSSITILLISKGMKDATPEDDQWIPWEIAFSLKETTRDGRTSYTNTMLAIVLPDENYNYDYFWTKPAPCHWLWHFDKTFKIVRKNMFNRKEPDEVTCQCQQTINKEGAHSFIYAIKWQDPSLIELNYALDRAEEIRKEIDDFNLSKTI